MSPVVIAIAIVVSYFMGTIPSAIIIARSKGIDIMSVGSGNPGASNIARTLGWKYGSIVLIADFAKSAIPATVMLGHRPVAYACGAAAIVGHIFPVTRGFKGGKGVASGAGALLPIHPVVILGAAALWFIITRVFKKSSVASIAAVAAVAIALPFVAPAWECFATLGIAVLIEIRHASNIKRLIAGNENTVIK